MRILFRQFALLPCIMFIATVAVGQSRLDLRSAQETNRNARSGQEIVWKETAKEVKFDGSTRTYPMFEGAVFLNDDNIPYLVKNIRVSNGSTVKASLKDIQFEEATADEQLALDGAILKQVIEVEAKEYTERKSSFVRLSFVPFRKNPSTGKIEKVSDIEPYLLKEHNKRWYLIAFDPYMNGIRPFSLDRIIEITHNFASRQYRIPASFDPKNHWKDCIGIYTHPEGKVSDVSFDLKNGPKYNNVNYLISLPMHTSQKAIKVDEIWTRFEYKIQIGPEVVRQIRQWGLDNVRNILPEELDDDVRKG